MRPVSSDVGSVSDELKAHIRVSGVSGFLFVWLLVIALPEVKQSIALAGLKDLYADFSNRAILLLFAAWIAFASVLTRVRSRTIQETSP